jgi:Mor family transcriptional regulator
MVSNQIINLEDLYGEQKSIAEVIGVDAYIKLAKIFGGTSIYVAKMDKIENAKRDKEIVSKFNGYNYTALAREYGLSDRTIRGIIADYRSKPLPGQLSFWEN